MCHSAKYFSFIYALISINIQRLNVDCQEGLYIQENTDEQWNLPRSKIIWLWCIFGADYRSAIRFAISPKISEEQAHLD